MFARDSVGFFLQKERKNMTTVKSSAPTFAPWAGAYPDMAYDQQVWTYDQFASSVLGLLGSDPPKYDPHSSQPMTTETFEQAVAGDAPRLQNMFIQHIRDISDDWEFALCTPQIGPEKMTLELTIIKDHILEPMPEDSVPYLITHRTEQHQVKVRSFHIGAEFRNGVLQTPRGADLFGRYITAVIMAARLTAKFTVNLHVANSKNFYRHRNAITSGADFYTTLSDGTAFSRSNFGRAAIDPKWFWKAIADAKAIMRTEQIVPDNVVGPEGFLDTIALLDTNSTAYQVGADISHARLTNAGNSLVTEIPGMRIWENSHWNVERITEKMFELFTRGVSVSQHFLSDGTVDKRYLGSEYDPNMELAVSIPDLHDWREITPRELNRNDMRWNSDGELHERHQELLDSLPHLTAQRGLTILNGKVDPFVFKGEGMNEYHLLQVWGEAMPQYWTFEDTLNTGKLMAMRIESIVRREKIDQISRLLAVAKTLSRVDFKENAIATFVSAAGVGPKGRFGAPVVPADPGTMQYPYGFGGINGLRQLAQQISQGGLANWSTTAFVTSGDADAVVKGVRALEEYYEVLRRMTSPIGPNGEHLNAADSVAMCPSFMWTGIPDVDRFNAFVYNTWTNPYYPIFAMGRVTATVDPDVTAALNRLSAAGVVSVTDDILLSDYFPDTLVRNIANTNFDLKGKLDSVGGSAKVEEALTRTLRTAGKDRKAAFLAVILNLVAKKGEQLPLTEENVNNWSQLPQQKARTSRPTKPSGDAVSTGLVFDQSSYLTLPGSGAKLAPANPRNPRQPLTQEDIPAFAESHLTEFSGSNFSAKSHIDAFAGKEHSGGAAGSIPSLSSSKPYIFAAYSNWLNKRLSHVSRKAEDWNHRACSVALCYADVHRSVVENFLDNKVKPPFSCHVVLQRGVLLRMASLLFFKGGSGMYIYRTSQFAMQLDGAHFKWFLHAAVRMAPFHVDPRALYWLTDVIFRGIEGGYQMRFVTDALNYDPHADIQDSCEAFGDLFVLNMGGNYGMNSTEGMYPIDPFLPSGRPQADIYGQIPFSNKDALFNPSGLLYPSQLYYNLCWHFGITEDTYGRINTESWAKENNSSGVSCAAFRGTQRKWNQTKREFCEIVDGSSHLAKFQPPLLEIFQGSETIYTRVSSKAATRIKLS